MTKVIAVRVGRPMEIEEMVMDVPTIQKFVGGSFEGNYFGRDDVMIYCNGDGKHDQNCKPNRYCSSLQDMVMGDFLVVRANHHGDEVDVTDADLEFCRGAFTPAGGLRW